MPPAKGVIQRSYIIRQSAGCCPLDQTVDLVVSVEASIGEVRATNESSVPLFAAKEVQFRVEQVLLVRKDPDVSLNV